MSDIIKTGWAGSGIMSDPYRPRVAEDYNLPNWVDVMGNYYGEISAIESALSPENKASIGADPRYLLDTPVYSGYGSQTIGGYQGEIVAVTNLNDDGPGSFRAACALPYPRIVTFDVSGNIELTPGRKVEITEPYITILGQSAPNGGVCVKGATAKVDTNDVIIQHMRFRPGPVVGASDNDALQLLYNAENVLIDHCSLSWSTDENFNSYGKNVTIQWCLISEGLYRSTHPSGAHSMGMIIAPESENVTIHHNLLAQNHSRLPRISGGTNIQIINNTIFNGSTYTYLGGITASPDKVDFIGNFYRKTAKWYEIYKQSDLPCRLYIRNNLGLHRPTDDLPETDLIDPAVLGWFTIVPEMQNPEIVGVEDCMNAYYSVLANVGATLPRRDSVDERVIGEVIANISKIIDDPSEVGGWPDLTT